MMMMMTMEMMNVLVNGIAEKDVREKVEQPT